MALGDIKGGPFEIVYRAKGTGTLTAGIAVAFDASGNVIPATATTEKKHGALTALTHIVGATTYYGVLMKGRIVMKSAGAIKPNFYVESDSVGDVITISTATIATAFVQAEIQDLNGRQIGRYVRKESDNQYAASDAADNDSIIIEVGF